MRYEDNPENRALIVAAAERLAGSAEGADGALQLAFDNEDAVLEDFDVSLLELLDDLVVECEVCGFWAEAGAVDDGVCADCAEEDDE